MGIRSDALNAPGWGRTRGIDFTQATPYFALLLAVAVVAFWPTYLAIAPSKTSAYTHLHALTATLWLLMLISQPLAMRFRRMAWHRTVGRLSYVLAPAIVLTIVLLAHSRLQGTPEPMWPIRTYILYLQVALGGLFALAYAAAIATRRRSALHARFMVCTALTLIDPIVVRLMLWVDPTPSWNYQWVTFGVTDLVLLLLIWRERHRPVGWQVFPCMLAVFLAVQVLALTGWTNSAPWQAFARWFAELPLT